VAEFLNKNFLFGGGIGTGAENLYSLKTNANTNLKKSILNISVLHANTKFNAYEKKVTSILLHF
jgi:hypothetical protein